MVKGGYQIINLEETPLRTGIGMQYDGLYEKIESTRKPILLSGINIDGVEYHDTYVEAHVDGSSFVMNVYGKKISINDNDVVEVSNVAPSGTGILVVDLKGATVSIGGVSTETGISNLETLIRSGTPVVFVDFYKPQSGSEAAYFASLMGTFITTETHTNPHVDIGGDRFTVSGSQVGFE